jgi:hypothetical protein
VVLPAIKIPDGAIKVLLLVRHGVQAIRDGVQIMVVAKGDMDTGMTTETGLADGSVQKRAEDTPCMREGEHCL